jgi:hypothetical protein
VSLNSREQTSPRFTTFFLSPFRAKSSFCDTPRVRRLTLGYNYVTASDFAPSPPLAMSDKTRLYWASRSSTFHFSPITFHLLSCSLGGFFYDASRR